MTDNAFAYAQPLARELLDRAAASSILTPALYGRAATARSSAFIRRSARAAYARDGRRSHRHRNAAPWHHSIGYYTGAGPTARWGPAADQPRSQRRWRTSD